MASRKRTVINGAPRIAVVRSYNFEHADAAKTFKWFGGGIGLASWAVNLSDVPIQRMGFSWPFLCVLIYV